MVHDVLQSDIEFARAQLQSNHSESDVVTALQRRGVDETKASKLVTDLRNNVAVKGTDPLPVGGGIKRRLSAPLPPSASVPVIEPDKGMKRHHHSRRAPFPWWFLIIVVIFIWALAYAIWHDEKNTRDFEKHEIPAKPTIKD